MASRDAKKPSLVSYGVCQTPIGKITHYWTVGGLFRLHFEGSRDTLDPVGSGGELPLNDSVEVEETNESFKRFFEGDLVDFHDVRIDTCDWSPFFAKVYDQCRRVLPGETISYGELASRAGSPLAARAAGQAMARNRVPLIIPCHRIIGSSGKLTGFSAPGGLTTKQRLLDHESRKAMLLFS